MLEENKIIKVFGHRSPDTDATGSAIVWAWFLNEYRKQAAQAYVLGPINKETDFVLETWGVDVPPILEEISEEDLVAITDTNNLDELFSNINDTHILSIIDHHKLSGNLKTSHPPEIVIQPYASTMTVMYNIMNIDVKDFPREIAGLMLSGILSDTLKFRSPTTTEEDKKLAKQLAEQLEINIDDYAEKMFNAKSDISDFSAKELVRMDSKIYDIHGRTMRISVLETTQPEFVLERYDEIVESFPQVREEDEVKNILLFVIDILKEEAILLTPDEETRKIAKEVFHGEGENYVILPGIVSRKKQIIPALLEKLK